MFKFTDCLYFYTSFGFFGFLSIAFLMCYNLEIALLIIVLRDRGLVSFPFHFNFNQLSLHFLVRFVIILGWHHSIVLKFIVLKIVILIYFSTIPLCYLIGFGCWIFLHLISNQFSFKQNFFDSQLFLQLNSLNFCWKTNK